MNTKRCKYCGKKIDKWVYSNALFCSDYCRKKYSDIKRGKCKPEMAEKGVKGVGKE